PANAKARKAIAQFMKRSGAKLATPLDQLKPKVRTALVDGDGREFPGLLALLEAEYQTAGEGDRLRLELFRTSRLCTACNGTRLRPEARSVKVAGRAIHELTALTVDESRDFFASLTVP